jgi:hypothetical protein
LQTPARQNVSTSPFRFRSLVKCKVISIVHTVQLAGSQTFLLGQAISDKFNQ